MGILCHTLYDHAVFRGSGLVVVGMSVTLYSAFRTALLPALPQRQMDEDAGDRRRFLILLQFLLLQIKIITDIRRQRSFRRGSVELVTQVIQVRHTDVFKVLKLAVDLL